jgi:predicted metal-dependent phosphotriesterase family hydrolase
MGGGTNGIPKWEERAGMVKKLIDAGLNDRMLLATDWMFGISISPTGTMDVLNERNSLGNLFNVRNTIPYLRRLGVTEEQIRTITVLNPRAFLARG